MSTEDKARQYYERQKQFISGVTFLSWDILSEGTKQLYRDRVMELEK